MRIVHRDPISQIFAVGCCAICVIIGAVLIFANDDNGWLLLAAGMILAGLNAYRYACDAADQLEELCDAGEEPLP